MKYISLTQCSSFTATHGHGGALNEAPHAHRFDYRVSFYGPLNNEGFLVDFRDVQQFLQTHINTPLDKANLNTLFEYPTTENLAVWIFEKVHTQFPQATAVRVYEAPDRWAEYTGQMHPTAQTTDKSSPRTHQAVLALGSNIAPAKENLDCAIEALKTLGTVQEVSPYIASAPEGFVNQADFVNTVLILQTTLAPMDLLKQLKALETKLGRVPTFPNGPRVIDLDILFYDDQVLFEDDAVYPLFIPHPRLEEREFVLKPLSYILPDYVHPKLGKPVYRLYRELMKKKGASSCRIL